MPILLVSANFPPKTGGSGRWFWDLYRRLPPTDCLVAAGICPGQEAIDALQAVRTIRVPLALKEWGVKSPGGLWGYAGSVRQLLRIVRREKVGIVHCGRTLPEGVMALALKWMAGIPYVCYVHGEEMNTAATSREFTFLVRQVLRGSSGLIANSHNTERMLLDDWGLPPEKVHVLHPGVDAQRYRPALPDREIRRTLGWNDRRVLLTVGRLQRRKGHDTVIRCLPDLRKAIPNIFYAIVGDGEERAYLEGLARELGVAELVQFLGEADDDTALRCHQQCDLFVLANRQIADDIEGFGIVLLEAQACEKAVVAGASGGTSETMRTPETGRLVSCEGPELLTGVLAELLADEPLRQRMGQAGRAWVLEKFDWQALTEQAKNVFRAVDPRKT